MNLNSWFTDKIIVQPVVGVGNSGQPLYGEFITIKCRVEHNMKKITDATGQEKISDAQIALSEKVGLQDRIWLPGADTSRVDQARKAQNFQSATSKNGRTTMMMLFL